jgi:molybdopterin-guanine dinucleotide biosynthesis protein A
MGQPKQLLLVDGEPIALRVARALAAVTHEIALGGDGAVPPELDAYPRLADAPEVQGPLAALVAASRKHPDAAWLIAACDLARVTAAAARWLISERHRDRIAVIPRRDGRPEPLFAVYEPGIAGDLEGLARSGRPAPRLLAGLPGVHSPEVPEALRAAFTNVNTPADLAELALPVAKPPEPS